MNQFAHAARHLVQPFAGRLRRMRWQAGLGAAMMGAVAGTCMAADDDFPQQPVTIVVPFAPGGSLDVTARIISKSLKDTLGQPVVIVNRPGAGSAVGARAVAMAKPDGYTLFFASGSAFGFQHLLVKSFDVQLKDFTPIAGLAVNTSLFAVNPKLPARSLSELIALADANPKGLSVCSTGTNGLNHLQLEMFKDLVNRQRPGKPLNMTHVPYNGVAPALTALQAGDVDACVLPYSTLIKKLDGTGIRVIAIQRDKRLPSLPDVATTGEQGFPEMDGNDQFVTVSAPAGTPEPVIRKLESALRSTMSDPAVMASLTQLDVQPVFVNSTDIEKWLNDDVRKMGGVIQHAGLVAQP
jgi:tripartite-type tricarboxylate transporter receptor subunit TctC